MKRYDVFISYRRAGGEDFARAVYQELCHRKYKVFLDRQNLESGDYEQQVLEVISNCRDAVIILPENALDRCSYEKDLFRKEIAAALEQQKNLIPIVRSGFVFPYEETLPEDIRALVKQEAIIETPESYDSVILRLTEMLDKSERIHKRKCLRKSLKSVAKITAAAAVVSGIIAGTGFGIVKIMNSSDEDSASQYYEIDRSNNNHEPFIVKPDAYAMYYADDNGRVQDIFLGETISEMYEAFGKDSSEESVSDRYKETTMEYRICFTGAASSFPYNGEQIQIGKFPDDKSVSYTASVAFLIENNKIINIHYALAVENEKQALEIMDTLFDIYDNGSGLKDTNNKSYTVSSVSSLNGDLELSCGTNPDGTMLFMYDVSNGMDIPSYLSHATEETTEEATETAPPAIEMESFENITYNCYDYHDNIMSSFIISGADVETSESYGKYSAECVIYGEKSYDSKGDNNLGTVSAAAQLLDEEGMVLDCKSFYTPSVRTGEKFKVDFLFYYEFESGRKYTIRIVEEE